MTTKVGKHTACPLKGSQQCFLVEGVTVFYNTGPHYCPQCPPIMVGKRKDRQVGPALNLVDQNYSGTGTDIVRCESCHKYFIITYKVDTIKALDRRS
jgi:hypothetical protein